MERSGLFDVQGVAQALGGDVVSKDRVLVPGPGHSPADRSLQVKLDPESLDGFVCVSFAGDNWRDCRKYVIERLGLEEQQQGDPAINMEHARARAEAAVLQSIERIARSAVLWHEAVDPRGVEMAEAYFKSRALSFDDDIADTVLRFHPTCPWGDDEYVPALLAVFRSIDDDSITGIHRIRLDQQERWPKAERRMLGVIKRAAVKIGYPSSDDVLSIGEGIETCIAACRLGYAPAWALGSAQSIARFPVLQKVACIRLLGEHDQASAVAVWRCADTWKRAGRRGWVTLPSHRLFKDFNDQLMWEMGL